MQCERKFSHAKTFLHSSIASTEIERDSLNGIAIQCVAWLESEVPESIFMLANSDETDDLHGKLSNFQWDDDLYNSDGRLDMMIPQATRRRS